MTPTLRQIFAEPIDRPIEGVIKADDEASLRIELDEYVITNEIEKHLERFLDAYVNFETANGAWISGFFGSGKSHLLKILALLLENRIVDGTSAYDIFKDKKKCADNEILAADLRRAVAIPSRSILFNIDQKADVISKEQIDALLSVFQKVFDESCGYYGKQPHIAQFERELDGRGVLAKFKAAYQRQTNKSWERGREEYLLEGTNIANAYAEAAGVNPSEAQGILSRYRQDFKVSIEDFANKVKAYIDAQGPKFRLNFFVDEVGQYIANNTKLMTNLQTIAESLNTKCRGQAWIIVTAQQELESVIGDRTQSQENDFSKIQARFEKRMPLSSADVAVVIQERLLKKTDASFDTLSALYHREAGNLKTLFDFADGSIRLNNFRDKDAFINSYPFIPYQYALFQLAIQNLSLHNAFEGKHSSVGERSMLGVFQDVVVRLGDIPVGGIASFDYMFEGIRTALKSNVQKSILVAERNLGDDFATRILKALFLVKYVRPFKASARNVATLMLDSFDVDLTKHNRRVEEALNLLEQNTYIQRNGELFEFLTDEEKDVEQEIKATGVDQSEIRKEIETILFDTIIKSRKIKHVISSHEYAFSRRLDDVLLGREYALSINIISHFHEHGGKPELIRPQTLSKDELAVVLKADARFASDLMMYKRTDKYVRQARSAGMQPAIERIIGDKAELNNGRLRDLVTKGKSLLADATLLIRGEEIEIRAEDPQARIERAFQTLVDKVYVNLAMLRGVIYSENAIGKFLRQGNTAIGDAALTEAEQEVINFAQTNIRNGVRTTVKALVERFEGNSYGWPYAAILCTTAGLIGRGKLEARSDGTPLEGDALERGLKNAHSLGNIVLDLQVEFTQSQVRKLRDIFNELFDAPTAGTDGKALGIETAAQFVELRKEIDQLAAQRIQYPFLSVITQVQNAIIEVSGKSYAWYVQDLPKHEEALLDAKEKVLDPVRRFMGGAQKTIFDEATAYLALQTENFAHAGQDEAVAIRAVLADPGCFRGKTIQQMKTRLDALKATVKASVQAERTTAHAEIAGQIAKLFALTDYEALPTSERQSIKAETDIALDAISSADLIAVIRDRVARFRTTTYPSLLSRVTAQPVTPAPPNPAGEPRPAPIHPAPAQYVAASSLLVSYPKAFLADEQDVNAYLDALRETWIKEIRAGKRISI